MSLHGDEVGIYCFTKKIRVVGINLEVSVYTSLPSLPMLISYCSCDGRRPCIVERLVGYITSDLRIRNTGGKFTAWFEHVGNTFTTNSSKVNKKGMELDYGRKKINLTNRTESRQRISSSDNE